MDDVRTLVVAQAPSRTSDAHEPLTGRSGARLAVLCGLTHAEFLRRFERVNLLDAYPGKTGKGDAFDAAAAREAAGRIAPAMHGRSTVLLGRNVAAAFMGPTLAGAIKPLAWLNCTGFRVACCPHPSGVCQWWNDPANVRRARRFWRSLWLAGAPGRAAPRRSTAS